MKKCSLTDKKCLPCEGEEGPLPQTEIVKLASELGGNWKIVNEHHLEKEFFFKDFKEALAFTNKVGALAEKEGHHPDIHLSWGKVRIILWTHSINALSENDFIFASKCDALIRHLA